MTPFNSPLEANLEVICLSHQFIFNYEAVGVGLLCL